MATTGQSGPEDAARRTGLVVGHIYTREEARRLVGCGPLQGFFAHKDKRPRAVFPKEQNNRFVRNGIITIHDYLSRPRGGPLVKVWVEERVPVHVFVWVGPHRNEYAGLWRPTDVYEDGQPLFAALVAQCPVQADLGIVRLFVQCARAEN